jgi:hypothetical protein
MYSSPRKVIRRAHDRASASHQLGSRPITRVSICRLALDFDDA